MGMSSFLGDTYYYNSMGQGTEAPLAFGARQPRSVFWVPATMIEAPGACKIFLLGDTHVLKHGKERAKMAPASLHPQRVLEQLPDKYIKLDTRPSD